jgi:tRNA A-37 threonylcarbamoyl transferase component Bud32
LVENVAVSNRLRKLSGQILEFGRHIAGSGRIVAAYIYGDSIAELSRSKVAVEVVLVIRGFQAKLMNYVRVFDGRTVIVVVADEWVFERDVDRGFLGEALVWGLILPYLPLTGNEYLHSKEVKLKKRLACEILENLVLDYPELSYELCIKPEYFVYETVLSRARLFPPIAYSLRVFLQKQGKGRGSSRLFHGFSEALKELEKEGVVWRSDGYVRMFEDFVNRARNPKVRIVNLSKNVPRALFTSLLGIVPRVANALSQDVETLLKWQWFAGENSKVAVSVEDPEEYVFVPTASGLVPLANKTNIEEFARSVLFADEDAKISIKAMGGILNDVYLVKASMNGEERKVVVKRFKDWSGFKWFPITLWSVGTRTFAVLGRSRLERECAINELLRLKGFNVPRLLHVSPDNRLVFMEYVEGENVSKVIKRLAAAKNAAESRKDLKVIERIGRKLAKVHNAGVALGDTKPENVVIGPNSEIIFMDFEQAARGGDRVWDVAEFLYYAGHEMPPLVETRTVERIAEAFVAGYLSGGGSIEVVRKAANPKYTKVFGVFALPHVMLAISNVCRKAGKLAR